MTSWVFGHRTNLSKSPNNCLHKLQLMQKPKVSKQEPTSLSIQELYPRLEGLQDRVEIVVQLRLIIHMMISYKMYSFFKIMSLVIHKLYLTIALETLKDHSQKEVAGLSRNYLLFRLNWLSFLNTMKIQIPQVQRMICQLVALMNFWKLKLEKSLEVSEVWLGMVMMIMKYFSAQFGMIFCMVMEDRIISMVLREMTE